MTSGTSAEHAAREDVASRTHVCLRPLAGPLGIGFFALAAATFVLSGLNLGWVEPEEGKKVALCLLAFTAPLQLLASVLSFLARDGVAATGMGLLAGIWAVIGLVLFTSEPGATSDALGLFLLAAAVGMWIPATAAASAKLVPALVLFTAGLRFGLTGVYELSAEEAWEDLAGIVGLVLAGLGAYAAAAVALEDATKLTLLPLGRRGKGELAVKGTYAHQVAELAKEPGVRQQL